MGSIIGFCGRKESGKSELAKVCEEFGYERLSFATPLKHLICNLISCDIDTLNKLKTVESSYTFGTIDCLYLSKETNIPIEIIKEKFLDKRFTTVRQLLQFIGTDLIRNYNPNWHVNKMIELIDTDKNYAIDDVRFPNEAKFIKDLNTKMLSRLWFVLRPKLDNISNHESETALKWQDFRNIIVNDTSLEYLKEHWRNFMQNGYESSLSKRGILIDLIEENLDDLDTFIQSHKLKDTMDELLISEYQFTYKDKFLKDRTIEKVEVENEHAVVHYDYGVIKVVDNPFEIEDLKILL